MKQTNVFKRTRAKKPAQNKQANRGDKIYSGSPYFVLMLIYAAGIILLLLLSLIKTKQL